MTSKADTAAQPTPGGTRPEDGVGTGEADRPPGWFRPGYAVLLVGSALLYLWNLGAGGYANVFYAAAVQASTRSPVAWLFAAVDAPGFITVDKPPADNWWMGLWANVFGFSSWSMLIPQALLGVGSVALVVLAVRRWSGPGVALLAGALLAITPVAVIMFRFDDPDPMLTFLLVAGAYAVVRAVDAAPRRAGTWWLVAAGALVGLGFLAKMGVALFVVPAFGVVYLVAANVSLRRRIARLAGGLAGLVVGAGWFLALVALWPTSSRPWIGGSTDNSLWQLAVGYNGLSRILGRGSSLAASAAGTSAPGGRTGPGGFPGGPGGFNGFNGFNGFGGQSGPLRLFTPEFAGQIAWLLPAALLAFVALLWVTRRATRTDRLRAATLLWGVWLVTACVVLSFMAGMVHTYYTVVMAPPLAAMIALGAREGWRRRDALAARVLLAVGVVGTAAWAFVILTWTPTFVPWLRWVVLAAAVLAAVQVLLPRAARRRGLVITGLTAALFAVIGGPGAYAVDTVGSAHAGTQATAGPQSAPDGTRGGAPSGHTRGRTAPSPSTRGGAGAPMWAGFGRGTQADPALDTMLAHAGTTWSAAVPTTMAAAGLELTSNTAVMGIGGFSGSDPAPTLAEFEGDVVAGHIHYFIAPTQDADRAGPGGGIRGSRATGTTAEITQWVQSHYRASTVGGATVYDLTAPVS